MTDRSTEAKRYLEKARSLDADVIRVMKWKLASTASLKRLAMKAGGFDDVIQDACLRILRWTDKEFDCHWSTAVCKNVEWAAIALARTKPKPLVHVREDYEKDFYRRAIQEEENAELIKALEYVSKRSREVIYQRYWKMQTLKQCSSKMKVTKERVRQIEQKGLRLLREFLEIKDGVVRFMEEKTKSILIGGPLEGRTFTGELPRRYIQPYRNGYVVYGKLQDQSQHDMRRHHLGYSTTKHAAVIRTEPV